MKLGFKSPCPDLRIKKFEVYDDAIEIYSNVIYGEVQTGKMEKEFSDIVELSRVSDLKEAVLVSYNKARRGDKVLLSPMCASFDQFENFEHRGTVFKKSVKELKLKKK